MNRPSDPAKIEELRRLCLSLPEVTEKLSHGEPSWFVAGKQFVTTADHHHDDRLSAWCAAPEGAQEMLVKANPARFFRPPYVGHRGWLGVYLDVEINPEPSAVADLGRPEEPCWICLHEHLLCALGRRTPRTEPVVVVVVRGGDELLAGDEPRRFTMAELLGHLGEAQAKPTQLLDFRRVAGSVHPLRPDLAAGEMVTITLPFL